MATEFMLMFLKKKSPPFLLMLFTGLKEMIWMMGNKKILSTTLDFLNGDARKEIIQSRFVKNVWEWHKKEKGASKKHL